MWIVWIHRGDLSRLTGGRAGPRMKETLTDERTKRTTGRHPARNAVPQGSARRASSCFLTCTSRTWASLLRDERDCSGSIIAQRSLFSTRVKDARNEPLLFRRLSSLGRIFVLDFRSYGSATGRCAGSTDAPRPSTATEDRDHPRTHIPRRNIE